MGKQILILCPALLVALTSCGGGSAHVRDTPPRQPEPVDAGTGDADEPSMDDLEEGLGRAITMADCEQACVYLAEICRLADRICEISERNAGDPELEEQCVDAQGRCAYAGDEVEQVCLCE